MLRIGYGLDGIPGPEYVAVLNPPSSPYNEPGTSPGLRRSGARCSRGGIDDEQIVVVGVLAAP